MAVSLVPRRLAALALSFASILAAAAASAQEETKPDVAPGTSGYHNGTFYVRSPDDVFRLYVFGRVHADWYNQLAPGSSAVPPGNGITNGFNLRRARLEIAGEFYEKWQWQVSAELASSTATDNPGATLASSSCTPDANGALQCAPRENPVENATVKPIPTDVFVNYAGTPWTNVEVGQFYLPFTMENRISDNTTPFLERSLPVRAIGAPLTRDMGAMFWGESPDRFVYYSVGIFNGDGPNRTNVDSRYDVAGAVFVRPFVNGEGASKWARVGASARAGSRDPGQVGYDMPALTTQDGYAFWKPTYRDSLGRVVHVIPSASQWALAGDVYLPIDGFDLTGEFVYASSDTREAVDGYQLSPYTERLGTFKGYGWYAQAGYWVVGDRDIIGHPTYGRPVHVDLTKPQATARQGVQVLAKFEQLHVSYASASRGGAPDAKTPDGDVDVDVVEFGANYWATKHLRVGVNYGLYVFPGSAPTSASQAGGPVQTANERAVAPGQLLAKGVDNSARDSSHTLNEISVRVGVQF
jgi:phosphate-selective porin